MWGKVDVNYKSLNKINIVLTKVWIFCPISRNLHNWPHFFNFIFQKCRIYYIIYYIIFVKSMIPEFCLLFVKYSICKIRHFCSAKRSFENQQSMIGRIFFQTKVLFLLYSIEKKNMTCHYKTEYNINKNKANYTTVRFKCKRVNFIVHTHWPPIFLGM